MSLRNVRRGDKIEWSRIKVVDPYGEK